MELQKTFDDDAGRLTRIERKNAAGAFTSKSEFSYDYAGRKAISREFSFFQGRTTLLRETRRVFDGLDVIQERNSANEVTAQYVRDGNIGGILARTSASGKSYFHYDGGGNVTALSDETGALAGRYSYDAFGNTLEASGARAAENPYRFSTKEHIGGLVDYGFRFYSPGMGRWLNRDPIRESGGVNLYGFVGNDPVNEADPYGLQSATPYGKGHHLIPGALWRHVETTNAAVWNIFNAEVNRIWHPDYIKEFGAATHGRQRYNGIKESQYRAAIQRRLDRALSRLGLTDVSQMTADQAQDFANCIKRAKSGPVALYNAGVRTEMAQAIRVATAARPAAMARRGGFVRPGAIGKALGRVGRVLGSTAGSVFLGVLLDQEELGDGTMDALDDRIRKYGR